MDKTPIEVHHLPKTHQSTTKSLVVFSQSFPQNSFQPLLPPTPRPEGGVRRKERLRLVGSARVFLGWKKWKTKIPGEERRRASSCNTKLLGCQEGSEGSQIILNPDCYWEREHPKLLVKTWIVPNMTMDGTNPLPLQGSFVDSLVQSGISYPIDCRISEAFNSSHLEFCQAHFPTT